MRKTSNSNHENPEHCPRTVSITKHPVKVSSRYLRVRLYCMRMGLDQRTFAKPNDDGSTPDKRKRIPYSAARNIAGGTRILDKDYSEAGWRQLVDSNLSDASEETRNTMYKRSLPSRIPNHLLRLLARKGPEYNFGAALLQYGPEYFEDFEASQPANKVLSAEFSDTVMWWTFAPYLYQSLTKKSIAPGEAVVKIIDWAKSSDAAKDEGNPLSPRFTLQGLEPFNHHGIRKYALTDKPDDLSHKFTAQEAERIVRDVFGIKDGKE